MGCVTFPVSSYAATGKSEQFPDVEVPEDTRGILFLFLTLITVIVGCVTQRQPYRPICGGNTRVLQRLFCKSQYTKHLFVK